MNLKDKIIQLKSEGLSKDKIIEQLKISSSTFSTYSGSNIISEIGKKIIELRESGFSLNEIMKQLSVSKTTVAKYIKLSKNSESKNKPLNTTKTCRICTIQFTIDKTTYRRKLCESCSNSKCVVCGKQRDNKSNNCSNCQISKSSLGGKVSAQITKKISYTENYIYDYLKSKYQNVEQSNTTLLDGFEIDILMNDEKIAIEYDGALHFQPSFGQNNLNNVKNRDRFKFKAANDKGFDFYPIFWYKNSKDKIDRINKELYFLEQKIIGKTELTPFSFDFNLTKFKYEYDLLKKFTPKNSKNFFCLETMDWYHKHIWFMRTSTSKLNSVEYWKANKDKIIKDRIKYANKTDSRALRRYFKLRDIVPTFFPDSLAKHMASMIDGNVIGDPFAGFGGRMLGACSLGKEYIGCEINEETINANVVLASDLDLKAKIIKGHSEDIECDGIITSPPFFNKEDYGVGSFKDADDYLDQMNKCFSIFKIKDKAIIDYKDLGVPVDKFCSCLPWKVEKLNDVNFGGLGRKSIHKQIICNSKA